VVAIHRHTINPSPNILRQAKKMIVPKHITHTYHQAGASLYLQFHSTTLNTLHRQVAEMTEAISKIIAEVVRSRWLSSCPRRGNEQQLLADIAEEER
jgi:hypothetical protein